MEDKILEKLINIELKVNAMERKQKKIDRKLDRIEENIYSIYSRTNIIEKLGKLIKNINERP